MKFQAEIDEHIISLEIEKRNNQIAVTLNGAKEELNVVRLSPHSYSVLMGGKSHYLSIMEHLHGYKVVIDQHAYEVNLKDETEILLERFGLSTAAGDLSGEVRAPIPGLVSAIFIEPSQKIKRGDRLLILEAMKMENEIEAPISGTVEQIAVSQGQSVVKDALLVKVTSRGNGDR